MQPELSPGGFLLGFDTFILMVKSKTDVTPLRARPGQISSVSLPM